MHENENQPGNEKNNGGTVVCGRCGGLVPFDEAEICWWCLAYLCPDPCWDEFGACHHETEAAFVETKRGNVERMNRAIAQNTKERKRNEAIAALRKQGKIVPKNTRFENGRLKF